MVGVGGDVVGGLNVFDAIGLVTSGFSGGAIFSLLLMIVYVVLCISLESKSF